MVRKTLLVLLLAAALHSGVYEQNCVSCHKKLPVDIDKFFYRYLLRYSSEKAVKKAMQDYLKNPDINKTVMPEEFIERFGIKPKSTLSDKELKEAIDTYWEKYKVFGKLK